MQRIASLGAALVLYSVVVSLPLILFLSYRADTDIASIDTIALLCMQAAFPLFALQPVLAARLHILDRLFGLDSVYLFHKLIGMAAGVVLLTAFSLFAFEAGDRSGIGRIMIPAVSSILAVILVVTALLYEQLRLNYERWRRLHNVLAMVTIFIVFFHGSFLMGRDIPVVNGIWTLLLLLGLMFYIRHKFTGPMRRRKSPYRVEEIRKETQNVWTLRLKPPEAEHRFGFRPGQFQFLTFMSPRLPNEEHPFTIASSPAKEGWHESTIKESGDFTSLIGRIQAGDPIAVQAPFGRFSYSLHPHERDLVFVAGGIGITPFMSMLRHMRDTNANLSVVLLYANNSEKDIAFKEELDEISRSSAPNLKVVHILSKGEESWSGERGYVDAAFIERQLEGDARDKTFYVCGPPPMMSSVIADVIGLGVPSSGVRSERFAL